MVVSKKNKTTWSGNDHTFFFVLEMSLLRSYYVLQSPVLLFHKHQFGTVRVSK